jgi:hypothetical protein
MKYKDGVRRWSVGMEYEDGVRGLTVKMECEVKCEDGM